MSEQNEFFNGRPTFQLSLPLVKLADQMLNLSDTNNIKHCAAFAKAIMHYSYTQELIYKGEIEKFPDTLKLVFDELIKEIDTQKRFFNGGGRRGAPFGNQNARKKQKNN